MTKIQDLIDQINNAERLGLSTGEVTSAKKELQLVFAGIAFDVDQALRFEPFDERRVVITQADLDAEQADADLQDEFIDLEPLKLWDED
jgi:hypothetical protein